MKILIAIAMMFTTGCAMLPSTESTTARLAVQYGTLKYIGDDVEKAARVRDVVTDAQNILDIGTSVTVIALDAAIRDRISWDRLDLADTLLLNVLLDELRIEMESRIGAGQLNEDDRVRVSAVFGWINSAAGLVR
jgi:hypothetical protein